MGLWLGVNTMVSLVLVRGRRGSSGFCGRTILSRRLAAAEGRQFEHGHARSPWFNHRVWLQRMGLVQRLRWTPLFHGGRRDYHARERRTLDRIAHECPGFQRAAPVA